MDYSILEIIISILFLALIIGVLFRYVRIPPVVGYLLLGAFTGPHALGLIKDVKSTQELAEFGIVFLMFSIGLSFSLKQLYSWRYKVIGLGLTQILISIAFTTIIGIALGMSAIASFIIGGIVAMSSTAIVMRFFMERGEIYSKVGQNALVILLSQDLAVVPFIIIMASISYEINFLLGREILFVLFNTTLAFLLIYFIGRYVLKYLLRMVARTKTIELFTMMTLLVALATSWLTHQLGLSYALGGFFAGVMLSESEFKHQIEIEIRPFRDLLLGLFFITVGMLIDISTWAHTWIWILLLVAAIVFCKTILVTILCRVAGNNFITSMRTGIVLAQGGEFSFAILTFAVARNLLPADYAQVVLAALWISIAISPLFILYNKQIANILLPKFLRKEGQEELNDISTISKKLNNHIILAGFGRVGQHLGRVLTIEKIAFMGLELDDLVVRQAQNAGMYVNYGDAGHPEILKAAGIANASAIIISFSDFYTAKKIVHIARQLNKHIMILVRCVNEDEITLLKEAGATNVVAETFEESLSLAENLLELMQFSDKKISDIMQSMRKRNYKLLRDY